MGVVDVDVGGVVGGLFKGLDDLFTSDEERKAAAIVEAKMRQEPHRLQALINIEEAKHASLYKGGWRPAIGYVCAAGLAWTFVLQPIGLWVLTILIWLGTIQSNAPAPPMIATDQLFELVLGMLGLAGLRTYEKKTGVTK